MKNKHKLMTMLLINGRARVSFGGYSLHHDNEGSRREGAALDEARMQEWTAKEVRV
jgi:hypothetical protein